MEEGITLPDVSIPLIKGEKGDKGDAGKISSLAITMLDSTEEPTVTNSGTVYDAHYTLGIPRGVSVEQVEINDDDELIITLSDDTELNVGVVVGSSIESVYIDEEYNLIVTLTDDTEIEAGNLEDLLNDILSNYYDKDTADSMFALIDETGNKVSLSINNTTYVVTLSLLDKNNNVLSTGTIDLPLESVVVSGSYDSTNKKIVLTLQGGSTVEFSVADLVSGLQSEITASNKLSADLVTDTSTTNKFVTASDKTNIAKISNSLMITKLSSNLALTSGNTPSLAEGYYYTGTYHVTVNGDTVTPLDDSIFYLNKSVSGFDFELTKIWGSGTGYPYIDISKITNEDDIVVIGKAPITDDKLVTSLSSSSTNSQVPSAKCVYDLIGDIDDALDAINGEVI